MNANISRELEDFQIHQNAKFIRIMSLRCAVENEKAKAMIEFADRQQNVPILGVKEENIEIHIDQ